MHARARELIDQLGLAPHPEGGMFRRTYASLRTVQPGDERGSRHALTAIYYLLIDCGMSRWHRVRSDEAWHWHEGAPLELFVASPQGGTIATHRLGPLDGTATPQHVVAADCWQAARCTGDYTLVGCCVAPGFEYADFTLLSSLAEGSRPAFEPADLMDAFMNSHDGPSR